MKKALTELAGLVGVRFGPWLVRYKELALVIDHHRPRIGDCAGILYRAAYQGLQCAVGANRVRQNLTRGVDADCPASIRYTYLAAGVNVS